MAFERFDQQRHEAARSRCAKRLWGGGVATLGILYGGMLAQLETPMLTNSEIIVSATIFELAATAVSLTAYEIDSRHGSVRNFIGSKLLATNPTLREAERVICVTSASIREDHIAFSVIPPPSPE